MSVVLKSVLNAYYSKDLGRKISSSFQQCMRQGTYKCRAPYGCRRVEGEISYQPDPEAAQVVRRIFNLALEKHTTKEIANQLNAEQIPPPALYNRYHADSSKKTAMPPGEISLWEQSGILTILRNEAYTGCRFVKHIGRRTC